MAMANTNLKKTDYRKTDREISFKKKMIIKHSNCVMSFRAKVTSKRCDKKSSVVIWLRPLKK